MYKTPKVVQDAMASEEASGPIPVVATFDARVENLIGIVPYFHMKAADGFEEVTTGLSLLSDGSADPKRMTNYQPETWSNNRGREIEATYVASNEKDVTLRLSNGKSSTIPISGLSKKSQERIAELAKN